MALVAVAACAPTPKHRIPVSLLVDGDRARAGALDAHAVAGLELRPLDIGRPARATSASGVAHITSARKAYVEGDFDTCRRELAHVDLGQLLATEQRSLAARAIAFDAACAYGAQAKAESEALAVKLASLGLEMPDAPLSHEAETLIARAITAVGTAPRHPLAVTGEIGGRLFVDGKAAGCVLPCTVDLPPGDHFIAVDTDGVLPATRWVRVPDSARVTVAQQPATASVALAQWHARIGRGLPAADAVGAKLLARIAPQPRIALVYGGRQRLTGTLVIDGTIRARAERHDDPAALIRELAYDGGVLERPAIWQRPSFWIATSAAVLVIAGAVVYAIYEPDVETEVGF